MITYGSVWGTPYYTGLSTSTLVPRNFPVAIAGHPYMIDVRKYSRRILPSIIDQQDTGDEGGEGALSREGFWSRSQKDWSLGAGQDFFDEDSSVRNRFLESKGVDTWLDHGAQLHHDTALRLASSTVTGHLLSTNGFLYVADGRFLRFTADPTITSPVWTSLDMGVGASISAICTDGIHVYVALGSTGALRRTVIGSGSSSAFGVLTPDLIAFANGRLIGADGNVLFEVNASGAMPDGNAIRTDNRTGFLWVSVVGHPEAIFAAGNVDNRSEVYAIVASDISTALGAPTFAASLPTGETMETMFAYPPVVLLGTSKGVRLSRVVSRTLEYGELIEVEGGARCLDALAAFCWFGWSDYDSVSTGLGRADLSQSTSEVTLVPAYASDLMATVQGDVTAVTNHDGRRYFYVAASGLWGEETNLVPSGTINSGWIRFSILGTKTFSGVTIGHDPLAGTVSAAVNFDNGSSRALGTSAVDGSVRSALFDASGAGVAAQLILTLTRDAVPTLGPVIRYWELNGLPSPRRSLEFIVPILLRTEVVDLMGNTVALDPLNEQIFLELLAAVEGTVVYQEGEGVYDVRVESVVVPEGEVQSWDQGAPRWFQCTSFVRLVSKEYG